jgi:hypothetical protein
VKDELIQAGAIISMTEAGSPTTGIWGSSSGFSWKGKDPNLSIDFKTVRESYDYGKTVGWHIKEGRDFSRILQRTHPLIFLMKLRSVYGFAKSNRRNNNFI